MRCSLLLRDNVLLFRDISVLFLICTFVLENKTKHYLILTY